MSKDIAICIREGIYRYNLNGTSVLFSREDGLMINNFKIENSEDVIKAIEEIAKFEKENE